MVRKNNIQRVGDDLKFLFWFLFVSQLSLVFIGAYSIAWSFLGGNIFAAIGIGLSKLLLIPVSLISIVLSIVLFFKKFYQKWAVVLLIFSLISIPTPYSMIQILGEVMKPCMEAEYSHQIEKNRTEFERSQEKDYSTFKELLRNPLKVIRIQGDLLLLENQKVIQINAGFDLPPVEVKEFLTDKLLGKKIQVDLGSLVMFKMRYNPGAIYGSYASIKGISMEDAQKEDFPRVIPADIALEGQSVGEFLSDMRECRHLFSSIVKENTPWSICLKERSECMALPLSTEK
jgi:hypothetical protein